MVQRGFEVDEPVMVKDYHYLGSAWAKDILKFDWVRSHTECKLESCAGRDILISYEN